MPLKIQVCPLSKAMDSDTGDKYINSSDGWIRERVGMRTNGLDGNSLFNNKLKGNILIDITLPSGTNKCIGWAPDYKTETILWFVHNSNSNHSILRLFVNTNVIQKVWYSQPGLNLIDDKLTAKVVDGRVYWCNGSQELKSFNIEKAVNFTNALTGPAYTGLENISEEILPWIKRPPRFAPDVTYDKVTELDGVAIYANNLRTKLFQFKYMHVFEDFQQSAWSPISKVIVPIGEYTEAGVWTTDLLLNNAIRLSISTGSYNVKKIIIAARDCSNRNITGDFYIIGEVDKFEKDGAQIVASNSVIQHIFLNNKLQANINTEINNRYFDDVPISCNDLEFIDAKYLAASMPVKGYDDIDIDYSLRAVEEAADSGHAVIDMLITFVELETVTNYVINLPEEFYPSSTYLITIYWETHGSRTFTYTTGLTGETYPEDARDSLIADMIASGLYAPSAISPNQIALSIENVTEEGTFRSSIVGRITTSVYIKPFISLKRGQYHPFGIVYNDGFGRYNIVFGDKELFSPISLDDPAGVVSNRVFCEMTINHRPPIWAKTYRICYLPKKSYTYFLQIPQVLITEGTATGDLTNGNKIPDGKFFIQPNKALAVARKSLVNKITPDYVWQSGDKARIVGTSDTFEILGPYQYMTGDPEVANDGFLIDGRDSSASASITLLEIFRPSTVVADTIYYEIGEEHEIADPGLSTRRHLSGLNDLDVDQSSDLLTPALLNMDFGDVYLRIRPGAYRDTLFVGEDSIPASIIVEDENNNDKYISSGISLGRAVVKIDSKQKILHRIVKTENFIEDTEYNLLNVFLPQSEFFPVSQSYGLITGIKEVGDVLKVVQEHKETSVYIGKASLKQADGTNITVISDKVFNQGNKYDALYGTRYLRSIAANDRSLYYFDDTTGDFIRSAPNGQASISEEYRMKTYFKAKAEELRISTNFTDIITTIDSDYDEVLITFINGNESETMAFYEKEGLKGFTWKAEIKPASGAPDNLGWYGSKVYGFLGGKIYQHNVGVLNEFFGHQKGCSILFIVNAGAGDANKFSNIELSSNKNIWDIQFDIEAGLNYPVQKSILKPTIIRSKENRLYSDILKNILGRNNTEDISKLRRGQDMTGETMLVTISNSTSEDVTLKEVEVKFLTAK